MGFKHICFSCRVAKSVGLGSVKQKGFHASNCTKCNKPMILINHSFRPPKKTALKAWLTAKYLVDNGFPFIHVYQDGKNEYSYGPKNNYTPYPKTLQAAKEFVDKHKKHRVKNN